MRALVGQFAPDSRWYRARTVELEGQPSWTLAQLRTIWARTFQRDTAAMVEALLHRDWSVLACTPWPAQAVAERRPEWAYVCGMGRAVRTAQSGRALVGQMGVDAPADGDRWAYLWEAGYGALHVYAAHSGRWHHLATLPADVWAALTEQLVVDVEARLCWLEREEAAA
ncbi:hypothetical protein GA0070610_1757 [Micromonospora echinofusca]|uniref:Uncharacterized protein n=1 Tax=Micromonospora echinofusca TaxID=47858 RepID=A0A1C5G6G9_MICEH|nr:hypothetical protein [Micromonospora echinofusca]SCG15523.1 hypothetical protein GA0070610_1757 [Micromonospora echinofusca]